MPPPMTELHLDDIRAGFPALARHLDEVIG